MTDSAIKVSDLPQDLVEEVLCRVPITSIRAVRLTCKSWNDLSNDRRFTKKHIAKVKAATRKKKEPVVVMLVDFEVYLMRLSESSVKREGKLLSLNDSDRINTSQIFHCDGLVLCVTYGVGSGLVVWNPYLAKTNWIEPTSNGYLLEDRYALGYGVNKKQIRSYKILRFVIVNKYDGSFDDGIRAFELYSFKSKSWKVLRVKRDWDIEFLQRGVSIKGNTYWFAYQSLIPFVEGVVDAGGIPDFLICFDFTTEKFGTHLPLPFQSQSGDTVTLSTVGEKQLAVLCQRLGTTEVKIWITSMIESDVVAWRPLFLAVDIKKPFTWFQPFINTESFFLDVKKKVVMVLGKETDRVNPTATRNIAYIIGKKGYFKQVDLGESVEEDCFPFVCSYVPTSVLFKQAAREIKVDKTVEEATQELESRGNQG